MVKVSDNSMQNISLTLHLFQTVYNQISLWSLVLMCAAERELSSDDFEQIRAEMLVSENRCEFCLIDFSVTTEYLPEFESVDEIFHFGGL